MTSLGKQLPPYPTPGEQERRADAAVRRDRPADLVDVRADSFTDVRDLVHERNAGRQHRVRGVLAQLRAGAIHQHDRRAGPGERRVELRHQLGTPGIFRADHHAIGLQEVVDGGALLQELRVAHHAERMRGLPAQHLPHLRGGPDRYGALVDDDLVAVHRPADLAGDGHHVLEVGRPILAGRRPDRDEEDLRLANRPIERGREREPLFRPVAPHELFESGLVDRHLPALQHADLGGILVHADDVIAVLCETRPGHEADVARSNNRDLHLPSFPPIRTLKPSTAIQIVKPLIQKELLRARLQKGHATMPRACASCSIIALRSGSAPASASMSTRWPARWHRLWARGTAWCSFRAHGSTGRHPVRSSAPRWPMRRIPVRALNFAWHRLEWPPVDWFSGAVDVAHSAHPLLMPARRALRVVTIHDLDFLDHPERTGAEIRRDYPALTAGHARRADLVVVVSGAHGTTGRVAPGCAAPAGWSCAGLARRRPCSIAFSPAPGPILFIGTIEPRKNLPMLAAAYEQVARRRPGRPGARASPGKRARSRPGFSSSFARRRPADGSSTGATSLMKNASASTRKPPCWCCPRSRKDSG